MKANKTILSVVVLLATIPCYAQDNANSGKTVESLYPNLAAGSLTNARVAMLPEGILLKTEGIEISSGDIEKAISGQPAPLQAELKKNAFFVLEQEATGKLLKKVAADKLSENGKDIKSMEDKQLVQTFLQELIKDIKVTDQDVETFYKENEGVFCGTPLDSVRKQIESYVLQDKQQRFVDQYIQSLGQKIEIIVSDVWTQQQADNAKDNPLDKARGAGKPTLAIFSAASCCGPDKMISVKEALIKKYDSKINIVYIEPKKEQILAARYGIRAIPSQIIYDSKGIEYFRHSGFLSENDIVGKFGEMGVQ